MLLFAQDVISSSPKLSIEQDWKRESCHVVKNSELYRFLPAEILGLYFFPDGKNHSTTWDV